jgi:hypothetical protein
VVDAEEGHELIYRRWQLTDYLFYCGGTDNYMFMEAVKKFEVLKRPIPNSNSVS